ncbi:hypothetical protein MNEG_6018 [Monoraphidium neglectum]|uniref:Uncharacterized protein n=1 Tax=Monoraphidium neglectum TaxID=145388 RepID=A0A0D2MFN0_9CHLO|nr:hypothetical protein MNEG_6018 [Monoraphidium neglectum]KIZ01940.1 hypothetical protein MNEG_6018 [Monoraphidium neglectum]|eukprot:XP_013900959.1 hypothetical protein MNEG_6018 [Monoraphidium neglectum]
MSSFGVRLLAPTGKEQPVVLRVTIDGISFHHESGKAIQQIPYASIIKWVPSSLRSRDPGSADCLDIQVETTAGRRDLRMRCASEDAVGDVITCIRGTVQVRRR